MRVRERVREREGGSESYWYIFATHPIYHGCEMNLAKTGGTPVR